MHLSPRLIAHLVRRAQFAPLPPEELTSLVEQIEAEGWLATLGTEANPLTIEEVLANLRDTYNDNRPNATSDEDVEALTRVAGAIEAVMGEETRRTDAADEREQRLAEVDAIVNPTAAADDAAGDGTEDPDVDDGQGDGADGDGEDVGGPADGEGEPGGDAADGTQGRVAASAGGARPPHRPSLQRLGAARTGRSLPLSTPGADPVTRIVASADVASIDPTIASGNAFNTREQLGQVIERLHRATRSRRPTDRRHYIGTVPSNIDGRVIDLDALARRGEADGALDRATERVLELRHERAREVASGGICAPATPDYTVTVIGRRGGAPFVQSLPSVSGSRPIAYYPWLEVDMFSASRRQAPFNPDVDPFAASKHLTAAQDAAGYVSQGGTTADKTCLHITCLDTVTATLEATYMCTTVGNFIGKGFPEFVSAFDTYTAIGFDYRRDFLAMQAVLNDPSAKFVTADPQFGAAVDLLGRIRLAATSIRYTRGIPDMDVDIYIPEFAGDMVAQDVVTSLNGLDYGGGGSLNISNAQAIAYLAAEENIHVMTYAIDGFGTTDDGSKTWLDKQADGPINEWPTQIRVGVWPTGTVFHQQAWEVSFGLQETLMGTNDYGTFMEQAEATHTRGTDIYFYDIGVCVNGVRGGTVVLDCTPDEG